MWVSLSLSAPWWALPPALIALCVMSGRLCDCRMRGTSVTLLANWSACTAIALATRNTYPPIWFFIFDYLSGLIVLVLVPLGRRRLSHWQRSIGALYAVELIVHAGVLMSTNEAAAKYYGWHMLHIIAWMQAVVVAIWGGTALLRRHRLHRRGSPPHWSVPASPRAGA